MHYLQINPIEKIQPVMELSNKNRQVTQISVSYSRKYSEEEFLICVGVKNSYVCHLGSECLKRFQRSFLSVFPPVSLFKGILGHAICCGRGGIGGTMDGRDTMFLKVPKDLLEMSGDPEAKKSRKTKGTKKAGCPARITMREIMMFPAYQVCDGMFQRRRTSSQLRAMLNETPDAGERRIYVSFPSREDHHGHHLVDSDRDNVVLDPRLLTRICELQASSQVQTVSDMKFLLKEFVTDVLCKDEPLPHKKDRRFFPTVSDIRKVLKRSSNTEQSKRFLVVHCPGESLDSKSDPSGFEVRVIDDLLGKFEVVSGGKSSNVNTVEFNSLSQSGLPVCSCNVWYKGRPPCEHFRAVFELTSWGIEKVPDEWRNFTDAEPENEYFMATLTPASKDQSCLQGENDLYEEELEGGEMLCAKDSTVEQEEKEFHLAEKAVDKIGEDILYDLRQECQDQLHRLMDLTHLVISTEALSHLKDTLMESVRDLEGLVSSDGSITLE